MYQSLLHTLLEQYIEKMLRNLIQNLQLLIRGSVRIIPSDDILKALEQDYEIKETEMIYSNPPIFKEIIQAIKILQDEINMK